MILHREYIKKSRKHAVAIKKIQQRCGGTESTHKNQLSFYTPRMNNAKRK